MIDCPNCAGTGKVKCLPSPVPLTRMQNRIYELLASVPAGLMVASIIKRVYPEGEPRSARNCVWVTISNANKRLAPFNQKIVSRSGWCHLKTS